MYIQFISCTFLVLLLHSAVFSQDIPMDTHNLDKAKCSIDFPQQWVTLDNFSGNSLNRIIAVCTSIKESPGDEFTENIIVTCTAVDNKKSNIQSRFDNLTDDIARNSSAQSMVVEKGSLNAGGFEGKWIVYTQKTDGKSYKNISYLFFEDGNEYLIACYSSMDLFDRFRPLFDKVAQSFRINK